jgi:hypothetical protein
MGRGRRESQWLVMRRCLAIIRRVQRGPASGEELVAAVLAAEGHEAYGDAPPAALHSRLEKDLQRIRDTLWIDLCFDRRARGYVIRDTWRPLLDLPDGDLATIAWLEQTFGPDSPQHDEIQAFADRLRLYLDPPRRALIDRCQALLALPLQTADDDEIEICVRADLHLALAQRRRVEFDYRSPQYEAGLTRRHVVDPYDLWFDPAHGHFYLRGWCHYSQDAAGRRDEEHYLTFRLGRISNLRLLPDRLPPTPPPAPHFAVLYELAPPIARLGVTHHREMKVDHIEPRPDGSALVRGTTDNLFWLVQVLLRYGEHCRVLGGPELLRDIRAKVKKMAELYADSP